MIWGQGDGSGLKVVDTKVGRVGALACWEHYNPLARYALMAQHEEIHVAQFPGSLVGPIFAEQIEVTIRHHALESGCFVVNATGWLSEAQIASVTPNEGLQKALRGGCMTAIVGPEGRHVVPPITEGEGLLIADLDMSLIVKRKRMMDSVGHYARPELVSLNLDPRRRRGHCISSNEPEPLGRALLSLTTERLINELQTFGARLRDPKAGVESRRGGAGPSDHKAIIVDGVTFMAPVHTAPAFDSPYEIGKPDAAGVSLIFRDGVALGQARFPARPRFYDLHTHDGVPYSQIADAARARRAGDDRLADLHPLSEPHQNLPVLRHRPIARRRPYHRAQDAAPARRSRARRRWSSTASSTW